MEGFHESRIDPKEPRGCHFVCGLRARSIRLSLEIDVVGGHVCLAEVCRTVVLLQSIDLLLVRSESVILKVDLDEIILSQKHPHLFSSLRLDGSVFSRRLSLSRQIVGLQYGFILFLVEVFSVSSCYLLLPRCEVDWCRAGSGGLAMISSPMLLEQLNGADGSFYFLFIGQGRV